MPQTQETNRQLCHRWFDEVWNRGLAATIDQLMTDSTISNGLTEDGTPLVGKTGFKIFYEAFRSQFTHIHVTIHHVLAEGDHTAMHFSFTAQSAATGKLVAGTGQSFVLWKNGLVAETWNEFDRAGLARQLSQ